MRYHLMAAVAAIAIATPAVARDGSPYVGIEGGVLKILSAHDRYQGMTGAQDGRVNIKHNLGVDVDAVAGYDFGFLRAEAELGWKRAGIDNASDNITGFPAVSQGNGGKARTVSAMGNLLADFGGPGVSGYVGGGVGVARTSYKIHEISFGATDSNLAWQIIAGVRFPVSPNLDAGLKYRYFNTKYDLEESPSEEVMG
jgi:opacity protein-like surface antigen